MRNQKLGALRFGDLYLNTFLASLPWYDLPELRSSTNALWHALGENLRRRGFADVPESLDRREDYESQWASGRLLFSQACGYDALMRFPNDLRIVATPVYSAPGCHGGYYSSMVIVRENSRAEQLEDLRGARCVINTPGSHSGMNALQSLVAPFHSGGRFFSSVTVSGSHEASLLMIARGLADVAAIDSVLYAMLERQRPQDLWHTRVVCCSGRAPAPPYVAGTHTSAEGLIMIREALAETLRDPSSRPIKDALLLEGVELLPDDAYQQIAQLERDALNAGYTEIHNHLTAAASVRTADPIASS